MDDKEKWKEKLLRNFKTLVHDADLDESVDVCFSEEIFTDEDKDNITSKHTKYEKNREFVRILLHKSEACFFKFMDSLPDNMNWIKERINETKTPETGTKLDNNETDVRRKVFRNFAKIVSQTSLKPLIDDFISELIFGIEDYETIIVKSRSTAEENKRLLNILLRKKKHGYVLLLSKLEEMGHSDLVTAIQGTDVNEDVDRDIEKHLRSQDDCSSCVPLHIQEQNEEFAKKWEEEDKVFIETRATKKIINLIENRNVVTVTGNGGTGKSATLHHLALQFKKKGYQVLLVQSPEEIKSHLRPNTKQMFISDDPVGVHSLDKRMFESWIKYNDSLECLVKNEIKLLCSIRRQVTNDSDFAKRKCILNKEVVSLQDGTCELNKEEKISILRKHFDLNGCDDEVFKKIETNMGETHEYFPLLCRLFTTSKDFQKFGAEFFVRPFSVVLENLDLLKDKDKVKYCTLVMCFVCENNLDPVKLRQSIRSLKTVTEYIMDACGVSRHKFINALNGSITSLSNVYLKQQGETYKFSHDLIYDVIAYHFGQENPEDMLRCGPSRFISDRVVVSKCNKDKDPHIIELGSEYFPILLERLLSDLEKGKYYEVMTNKCWDDFQFIEVFKDEFVPNQTKWIELFCSQINIGPDIKENIKADIQHVRERDIAQLWSWFYVATEMLHISGITLIHWTVIYAHTNLFDLIWKHLSHTDRIKVNANAPLLHYACLGGDISICTTILQDTPCDVNEPCIDEKSLLGDDYVCEYYPVHLAAMKSVDITEFILSRGANINVALQKGRRTGDTAISYAAGFGNAEMVSFLFKAGSTITCKTMRNAVQNKHAQIIQILLQCHVSSDLQDKDGCTALILASQNGHTEIVQLLLSHGASVDIQDEDGWTALMAASQDGHTEIVQLLLSHGASVDIQNKNGSSALIAASQDGHTEIVQLLLSHGASVDIQDKDGWTALILASQNGHTEIVQLLLSHGASVDLQQKDGWTALMAASQDGQTETVQLLVSHGASVDIRNNNGWTALIGASQDGHTEIVQLLLSHGASVDIQNNNGWTALMKASNFGHTETVQLLLSHDASVDIQHNDGWTALMKASQDGHTETVQLLLSHDASVDLQQKDGWTALMKASQNGHAETVQLLLDQCASVDTQTNNGWTALMVASQKGHTETVQLLLSHGTSVDAQNNNGWTALMAASKNGHTETVQLLLDHNASVNKQDDVGQTALILTSRYGQSDIVPLLLRYNANIDLQSHDGKTSLMVALENRHNEILQLLSVLGSHNVNFDIQDNEGLTALMVASRNGNSDVVKLLLDQSANVDLQDNEGKTALMHASEKDNSSVVELLLARNVNIYQSDNRGHTALWHAEKFDSIMSIQLIRDEIDIHLKTVIDYMKESNN